MKKIITFTHTYNGVTTTRKYAKQVAEQFADPAVARTEQRYLDTARELRSVYEEAANDLYAKQQSFLSAHKQRVMKYREQLRKGEITQEDYEAWMRGQVFQEKAWEQKRDQIARTMVDIDKRALQIVNTGKLNVFADNANYIGYSLEKGAGANLGFGVYDQNAVMRLITKKPDLLPMPKIDEGKDYVHYNNVIRRSITQGIIQGEDLEEIVFRIATETGETGLSDMRRNARTAYTGAQNAGRVEGMRQARDELGIKVQKRWMAFLDKHTRETHADADGQVVEQDEPFVLSDGDELMYPGDPAGRPENVYNCFVGKTIVAADSDIIRSYKHDYSGELITVKTACGVKFTCTPNHPILTPSGWVAAKSLNNGDNLLIASIGEVYSLRVNPYVDHTPSRIDAIHKFLDVTGSKRAVSLGVDFHGDVPASDVEIITQERLLRNNGYSGGADCVDELLLKHSDKAFSGKSAFMQHFWSVRLSALRIMCGFCKALSLFRRSLTHAVIHGFGAIARSDATVFETQADSVTGNVQFLGESLDRFPSKVFIDNIVNVNITTVSHIPVYNLQTGNSRYYVNSIIPQNGVKCNGNFAIAHNCRCTLGYEHPEYPTSLPRVDDTGENVGDMTYAQWQEMKGE